MPRTECFLGRPDIDAFHVLIHVQDTAVASVTVRNGRVLSPSAGLCVPPAVFRKIADQMGCPSRDVRSALLSAWPCVMPLSEAEPIDRHNQEAHPNVQRPTYVACPTTLAAGLVAAAAQKSSPEVLQAHQEALAVFSAQGGYSTPSAMSDFVDGWARGAEALALRRLITNFFSPSGTPAAQPMSEQWACDGVCVPHPPHRPRPVMRIPDRLGRGRGQAGTSYEATTCTLTTNSITRADLATTQRTHARWLKSGPPPRRRPHWHIPGADGTQVTPRAGHRQHHVPQTAPRYTDRTIYTYGTTYTDDTTCTDAPHPQTAPRTQTAPHTRAHAQTTHTQHHLHRHHCAHRRRHVHPCISDTAPRTKHQMERHA